MWRRLRDNPTIVLKQSYTKVAYECELAIHDLMLDVNLKFLSPTLQLGRFS